MVSASPKIPMLPSELPQQRISEVVPLEPRPAVFNFEVGYGDFPAGVLPRQGVPRSPDLLVQVEWAETPNNYGVEAFYLHARKACWVLWLRTLNDNTYPFEWDWQAVGYCNRKGVDRTAAATHLLLEYWRFERERGASSPDDDDFNWINEEGFLSIADVRAIVRELNWQRAKSG